MLPGKDRIGRHRYPHIRTARAPDQAPAGKPGPVSATVGECERHDPRGRLRSGPPCFQVVGIDHKCVTRLLVTSNPPLGCRVVVEAVVVVQMVFADVREHRDGRCQPMFDQRLDLPTREFQHDRGGGGDPIQLAQRRHSHVPGQHRPVIPGPQHRGAERGGRCLALRPRNPDNGGRTGPEKERHFHLDRQAVASGKLQQRGAPGNARVADHEIRASRGEVRFVMTAKDVADRQTRQRRQRLDQRLRRLRIRHSHRSPLLGEVSSYADPSPSGAQSHHRDPLSRDVPIHQLLAITFEAIPDPSQSIISIR